MLSWGSKKLDEIRNIMPEAGGLVIAPDIEMAKYMADILEMLEEKNLCWYTVKCLTQIIK